MFLPGIMNAVENLAHGAQYSHRKLEKLYKNTYISP
jgi:hypothetical protein